MMMNRVSRTISGLVLLGLLGLHPALSQDFSTPGYEVKREIGVMVPMRDGVRLATNVFRPDAEGRFPVVMLRTPYGRIEMQGAAEYFARFGIAGVWQDARGRFDSEGEWDPFFNEAEDGHDAVEWAAAQPWSNGKVVMVGGSYAGYTQWQAARGKSAHLVGIIPFVSVGDLYELVWVGGALSQGAFQMWSCFMDGSRFDFSALARFNQEPWSRVFNHLPVVDGPTVIDHDPAFYRSWLAHPRDDAFWTRARWSDECHEFKVAGLHITGWYDILQRDTIENFRLMHTRPEESVRDKQWLIVGPWAHQGTGSQVGEIDFGEAAVLNLLGEELTGFLRLCLSNDDTFRKRKPVRLFTMGENAWHDYDAWPVPGAAPTEFFLRSGKGANSAAGDGSLHRRPPTAEKAFDRFTYDPANPVPTHGGGNCCWPQVLPWGPMDQREIEARDDVLVYSTPALETPVRVTGPVEARLWVASSAVDTDFTAKLVDVHPDGYARNLTDGILRTRYRKSFRKPELLEPGVPVEIRIDLGATSNLFRKGHRIRLEISSSNFPRFSRNTNTGNQPELDDEGIPAEQKVFHDRTRPSRLILPVLDQA